MPSPQIQLKWLDASAEPFSSLEPKLLEEVRTAAHQLAGKISGRGETKPIRAILERLKSQKSDLSHYIKNSIIVVAWVNHEPIGMMQFAPVLEKYGIRRMKSLFTCIDPAFQKSGVARRMHFAMHGYARKHGYNEIRYSITTQAGRKLLQRIAATRRLLMEGNNPIGVAEEIVLHPKEKPTLGTSTIRHRTVPLYHRRKIRRSNG